MGSTECLLVLLIDNWTEFKWILRKKYDVPLYVMEEQQMVLLCPDSVFLKRSDMKTTSKRPVADI